MAKINRTGVMNVIEENLDFTPAEWQAFLDDGAAYSAVSFDQRDGY